MQKTETGGALGRPPLLTVLAALLALLALPATPAAAQTAAPAAATSAGVAAMQDSVVTVNQLIQTENLAAVEKARKDAETAGLIKPAPVAVAGAAGGHAPSGPAPATLEVVSIGGVEGQLHSRLTYNGTRFDRVRVGDRVEGCVVGSIDGRRVSLKPTRGVAANQCPSAVWTGVRTTPPGTLTSIAPGGVAMPMPVPGAPQAFSAGMAPTFPLARGVANGGARLEGGVARLENAANIVSGQGTTGIGVGGPPALPLDAVVQPTTVLEPARPLAPGETSVPLVPRTVMPNTSN